MTLIDEYFELTKDYMNKYGNKTIVLMQVGSFFECYAKVDKEGNYHGSLILEFSKINDMAIARKNVCVGGLDVVMAGFGVLFLEKNIKKLLENGYTVPVFVQDVQGKNTTRSLACVYSPGMYFNNNDNTDILTNNTMCIWINYTSANLLYKKAMITIAISNIDIITGKLVTYEYNIEYFDTPTIYDQLEKYISIYDPSETIIITNMEDENYINKIINYINLQSKKIHKLNLNENIKNDFIKFALNCEKQTFQEEFIDKIYGVNSFVNKEEFRSNYFINSSLCFLLNFVNNHNPLLIKNIDYPIFENNNKNLILANHSLKQLNIISDNNHNGKLSCVLSLLNNCVTNIGKRNFNYKLLHPTINTTELNINYDIIDKLRSSKLYLNIRTNLINIKDIEKIERKATLKQINPKDFSNLYDDLSIIKKIFNIFLENKENSFMIAYIEKYCNFNIEKICQQLKNFIEERFDVIKSNNIMIDKLNTYSIEDLNFINKNYDKVLNTKLKNCIDSRQQLEAISKYLSNLIADVERSKKNSKNNSEIDYIKDISYIKINETGKNDIMLLLTNRRSLLLKDIFDKLKTKLIKIHYMSSFSRTEDFIELDLSCITFKKHGSSLTNVILENPLINNIINNIQNSRELLINSLQIVYNKIVSEFLLFKEEKLHNISLFISLLDICQCNTYNVDKYNLCKPEIIDKNNKKSFFEFEKIRHCLIEQINTKELYVSNDLELGNTSNGLLLYGTNAVGKTSFIKSVGIAIIMAQSGMYVPCNKFIYYPYNYLFTRILGNDNLFKGLSTFAVEMSELRTILKYSNENSIILGDELCSGTESTSALSIFVASLEKLNKINSTFLFATHFHEILEYDEVKRLDKMKIYHMSVLFDKNLNTLIYDRKLKNGPGQAMYGLEVCKSLDLPDDFIDNAYLIRNKYHKKTTILSVKKTRYNSKKLKGKCELCNINDGTEIHHLQFQKKANINGIINEEFNKNHKANLINICEECHNNIHRKDAEYVIKKTLSGDYNLVKL